MNLFDGLQERMFDTVTDVFGYNAYWTPSIGGETQTARVCLKEPTVKEYELSDANFSPFNYYMEYRQGFFAGLIDAVRANYNEVVIINEAQYYVRKVDAAYDGKTYKCLLEKFV